MLPTSAYLSCARKITPSLRLFHSGPSDDLIITGHTRPGRFNCLHDKLSRRPYDIEREAPNRVQESTAHLIPMKDGMQSHRTP